MRKRSIRHRGKRNKRAVLDLDITSLLDILVIMLVFLLKSYNSSGIVINIAKSIELPDSKSQSVNTTGVNVQVAEDKIWVDDEVVFDRETDRPSRNNRINSLYNELVKKKQIIKQIQKTSPEAKKFSGIVNLVIDKAIPYQRMRQVMNTCAEAGFKTYKFVVLGEDN